MNLSRKEFFRRSLLSLGDGLLRAGEAVREVSASLTPPAAEEAPREPVPGEQTVARADNRHCLAKHWGCFTCLERCAAGAISLIPGEGIRIDAALCTGCGTCQSLCPLAPQAVALVPRGA